MCVHFCCSHIRDAQTQSYVGIVVVIVTAAAAM